MMNDMKPIAIIGGGLVGLMLSIFLAKKSFKVTIYEKRADPRIHPYSEEFTFDITLKERGIVALRVLGIEQKIIKNALKIQKRIFHEINGNKRVISLGNSNQFFYSFPRRVIYEALLSEIKKYNNITLLFNYKLVSLDSNEGTMSFMLENNKDNLETRTAYIIIGCDGAFSTTRSEINKITSIDYNPEYIWFLSLNIPANKDGTCPFEPQLHSWLRGPIRLNGTQNIDHSFGLRFYMPLDQFEKMRENADLIKIFEKHFPDILETCGKDWLTKITNIKPMKIVSMKNISYHYSDNVLLMGDAAHTIPPFLGQGINCGFEDCVVLDQLLTQNNNNLRKVLPLYSEKRVEDCNAIIDLSFDRFKYFTIDSKKGLLFLFRSDLDKILNRLLPTKWIPILSMIEFTAIPYKKCLEFRQKQDMTIDFIYKILIQIKDVVSLNRGRVDKHFYL